jgi:hypothetical protein
MIDVTSVLLELTFDKYATECLKMINKLNLMSLSEVLISAYKGVESASATHLMCLFFELSFGPPKASSLYSVCFSHQ